VTERRERASSSSPASQLAGHGGSEVGEHDPWVLAPLTSRSIVNSDLAAHRTRAQCGASSGSDHFAASRLGCER
jgi:hypothetical protein